MQVPKRPTNQPGGRTTIFSRNESWSKSKLRYEYHLFDNAYSCNSQTIHRLNHKTLPSSRRFVVSMSNLSTRFKRERKQTKVVSVKKYIIFRIQQIRNKTHIARWKSDIFFSTPLATLDSKSVIHEDFR